MEAFIQALPLLLAGRPRPQGLISGWDTRRSFGTAVADGTLRKSAVMGCFHEPGDAAGVSTAAKADGDEVDTSLWAVGPQGPAGEESRRVIRNFLYGRWCRGLYLEARKWLDAEALLAGVVARERSREGVRDFLQRSCNADWFEWKDGSRLFFWRWPKEWQVEARDGSPIHHYYKPKRRLTAKGLTGLDDWMRDLIPVKLRIFLFRRYLEPGGESRR